MNPMCVRIVAIICAFAFVACGNDRGGDRAPNGYTGTLPDTVTFAGSIAPIIWRNCTPCHRPGGAAPFPLITYADVAAKAKTIKLVTGARTMPPWPADTSYARFIGERVLDERSIALIARWVDDGAPPYDLSSLGNWRDHIDEAGRPAPDTIIWMPDTFRIPGDGRDRFMIAKAPFELPRDTVLRMIEFVPGNRRAVHHMNAGIVHYASGAKTDMRSGSSYVDAEATQGEAAFAALGLANDDETWPRLTANAVNHLPGLSPVLLPEGLGGYPVPRQGAFLLNSIHYGPSAHDTTDRSSFHLWYAKRRPDRPMKEILLGSNHTAIDPPLHLLPGEVKTFRTSQLLTSDISVITVNPHMHLLGERFTAYAVTPANDTVPLVRINDWDFRWQYAYTFRRPLHLPRGAVIHVEGTFDNTADNPDQPFDPPREVRGRDTRFMRTTDEMLQFFINYVDHRAGDELIELGAAP